TDAGPRDDRLVRTAAEAQAQAARQPAAGPPAIFDLPPALALKRYQEFALTVHPELQRRCAGCHHEQSGLPYKLARAATTREQMNALVLRTNLEATLGLIDRDDPARSPLLVASVLPHKGLNRPILNGTTNPTYKAFAQWTAGVSVGPASLDPSAATTAGEGPAPGGGFGSQRGRPTATPELPALNPTPPSNSANDPAYQAQMNAAATRARTQTFNT